MNDVNGLATDQRTPDAAGSTTGQQATSAVTQQQVSNQAQKEKPGFIKTANDEITYRIIGLAMEVHNELGPGQREEAYHNALVAKLKQTDLAFLDEPEILVELEDGRTVQKYVPDLIVAEKVLTELKTHSWPMTRDDMAQVFDYFAGTHCEVALFLNFGRPRLVYRRLLPPQIITDSHLRKPHGK